MLQNAFLCIFSEFAYLLLQEFTKTRANTSNYFSEKEHLRKHLFYKIRTPLLLKCSFLNVSSWNMNNDRSICLYAKFENKLISLSHIFIHVEYLAHGYIRTLSSLTARNFELVSRIKY